MPHSRVASLLALCALSATPLAAQSEHGPWFIRLGTHWASFSDLASSNDPAPGESEALGLGGSARYALGAGRRIGAIEAAIDVQTGTHPVEARDDGFTVGIAPGYTLTSADLTVAYPVLRFANGARLLVAGGPSLVVWSGDFATETLVRLGGTAGVRLVAPVTGPLAVEAHGALGLTASPVSEEELSGLVSSYDRPAVLSTHVGVSLRLSL